MKDEERRRAIGAELNRLGIPHRTTAPISGGCLSLDWALGTGGYPHGQMVEIFGPESSGKTTLALAAVAGAQRAGGAAAYIDVEHALDASWAATVGVDTAVLLVAQPDSGEQALEMVLALAASGTVDLVVVDSVAALVPRAELGGGMGDVTVGFQERMLSQFLRKLGPAVVRSGACLIFLNQIRQNLARLGNPERSAGGPSLKFHAGVRAEVRGIGPVFLDGAVAGSRIHARIVKNRVAPPFREAEFDILHAEGISRESDLLDLAAAHQLVEVSGAGYGFAGRLLGRTRDAARRHLKECAPLREALETALSRRLGLLPRAAK